MKYSIFLVATIGFLLSVSPSSRGQTASSVDSLIWTLPESGHILLDFLDSNDVQRNDAIAFYRLIQDSFPDHHIWIMISESSGKNALWLTFLLRQSGKATIAGSRISRFPAARNFFESNFSILRPALAGAILDDRLWKIIPDIEISPSGKASSLPFRSVRKYILRLIEGKAYLSGE